MASIYKQPRSAVWRVSYYRDGRRVRESLETRDERIAKKKQRRIEAELVTGELEERTNSLLVPLTAGVPSSYGPRLPIGS